MNKYLILIAFFGTISGTTLLGQDQASCEMPRFTRGHCYEDPNNQGYFILKTLKMPGWKELDKCYAKDGTVTTYGKKNCLGGFSCDECKAAARTLYLGMPKL